MAHMKNDGSNSNYSVAHTLESELNEVISILTYRKTKSAPKLQAEKTRINKAGAVVKNVGVTIDLVYEALKIRTISHKQFLVLKGLCEERTLKEILHADVRFRDYNQVFGLYSTGLKKLIETYPDKLIAVTSKTNSREFPTATIQVCTALLGQCSLGDNTPFNPYFHSPIHGQCAKLEIQPNEIIRAYHIYPDEPVRIAIVLLVLRSHSWDQIRDTVGYTSVSNSVIRDLASSGLIKILKLRPRNPL